MTTRPSVAVLFVCLGNICRSPAAHAVAETLRNGRDFVRFDSAGTGGYHIGEQPNPISASEGALRGHRVDHIVRQVCPDDFATFDVIVAMDSRNLAELERLGGGTDRRLGPYRDIEPAQLNLLRRWDPLATAADQDVADPWGEPPRAYSAMYDVVERSLPALMEHLDAMHRGVNA